LYELPKFPDAARPPPESNARKAVVHGAACGALVLSALYLIWRYTSTVDLNVWWVSLPLIVAETHNAFGLLLFTLALWDIDVSPPWHPVDETGLKVAVLVTTYDEPEEVLLPTIAAAVALGPKHGTWVLDDGHRLSVKRLAKELGARYLTRPDNEHAQAGNLNHALSVIDADVFAVFDADHVAGPNFLRHTLAYFDDPTVAIVQTPQDFYNLGSFEHEGEADDQFSEEAVFYRVIGPGKNKWDAAFWCGTSSLVRTAALKSVGGVATDSITEDIHTTIRLNRLGWKGVYHNEVLARGLAPADAVQYMLQRNRWAVGAMQVLRGENPLFGRALTFGQRLGFATTLLGWFDSWRTLAFVLLPVAVILTGASPIDAPGYLYAPFFLAAFTSQFLALRLLARGRYPVLLSLVFEMLRLPAVLPANLAIFTRGRTKRFRVTPKGQSLGRGRVQAPVLLVVLASLCSASLLWFSLTVAGLPLAHYRSLPVVIGSVVFAFGNLLLLTAAIARIRAVQYAGERRDSVRFDVQLGGEVDGAPCVVRDLSLTGALLRQSSFAHKAGHSVRFSVTIGTRRVALDAEIVRLRPDGEIALKFTDGQRKAVGRLILLLLNSPSAYDDLPEAAAHRAPGQLAAAA
jgi:cellulose synthase/poly-beta-1,6-N-acetylglucosamine synthase-like glycosyltransferase